ncbi:MAG TPA: ABC transporter ATP-binding protein [Flavisolibacter sp.]|nr:ABC transporter ATP-binding protein [Flavisolibacter sp.]
MEPAITVTHLSKQYKKGAGGAYLALRDVLAAAFQKREKKESSRFWALNDVSFSIQKGERIGIIGRNGAGKSTLLKIISRITPPTKGKVILEGRVASLLEVGTGFHPELTGRENIYLNGAILGLKKTEIQARLDEIISFSGVEAFIDTPLKHYSSGMQMRLAFSVAAHLDADILMIDEVLAVGDMEFQKKCIGKMEEISTGEGKTILFVSHNMNYITAFCNKAILLDRGEKKIEGDAATVVNAYLSSLQQKKEDVQDDNGNRIVRLLGVETIRRNGQQTSGFTVLEEVGIRMRYQVLEDGYTLWLGHNIHNMNGVNVFDTHSVNTELYSKPHGKGTYSATVWIPSHLLNTGSYFISTAIFNHLQQVIHVYEKETVLFNVTEDFSHELTARGMSPGDFPGVVRPLLHWQIEPQNHA